MVSREKEFALIYTTGGGRLGNQLLNYANLYAFSLECPDFDVIDLAFIPHVGRSEYGTDFSLVNTTFGFPRSDVGGKWNMIVPFFWGPNPVRRFVPNRRWIQSRLRVLHGVAARTRNAQSIIGGNPHCGPIELTGKRFEKFDLSQPEMQQRLRSRPVSVVAGWGVRGWSLVEKYRDQIRSELQPRPQYMTQATDRLEELREETDMVVGVLIRQGDYRNWKDGRYFYSSEEYKRLLDKFADSVERKVTFLIASNKPQPQSLFSDDRYKFTTGAAPSDRVLASFTELSLCDAIVTPPSTFSTFAAFLGDVPVVPLYSGVENDGWEYLKFPLLDSLSHPEMSGAVTQR